MAKTIGKHGLALVLLAIAPGLVPASTAWSAQGPGSSGGVNEEFLVSSAWLADHLTDPNVIVLQIGRDRSDYDAGHIPGARFVPFSALVVERDGVPNELPPVEDLKRVLEDAGVGDDRHIVLYGDMGGLAAARAFFTLDYLGHPRTSLLDGGLEVWKAEGRPLSTDAPEVRAGSFTPRVRQDLVVTTEWVRDHLEDPNVVLVDARPPAQYRGDEAGAVERPGHIPGAVNLFWQDALVSSDRPVLKSQEALRAMYQSAGIEPGDLVVAYCRTGVMASLTFFVSRYLGYETRLYDASFVDWSRRPDLPVARGAAVP